MKYSICVSGAAGGETVKRDHELAERLGVAVAKSKNILTTGATVGLPFFAARAAHLAGGMSIGFSPASSLLEHVHKYRLPIGMYDYINFTGLNYVGRDVYLVQSSDALVTVGGRFGSLHEFSTALESNMPCGVLTGSGGAADEIPELIDKLGRNHKHMIVFDDNPERLITEIIKMLDEHNKGIDTTALANQWFVTDPPMRAG
ncbi:MAG TPA: hypothetical protein VMR51_01775 [Patescibacteria group bacterium]|nr:hypothetical protein [Patescibacteria group bacterium]